jgi:DNA-binding response OmpR family regulator
MVPSERSDDWLRKPFEAQGDLFLAAGSRGLYMHILLVEDERTIAAYVKRGLEERGYAVDLAYTGDEALDWATGGGFELIILDLMIPPPDGLTVCRTLRNRGVLTPLLMLTARDTVDDRVTGLDAGADDYLVKPFAINELLARVRALTRRAADQPKTPTLRVADLVLDPRTHLVQRGGTVIDLTAKEFAILACLLRAPGQILTRTVIADHVWSYDTYHESNVIDVYIRNLRRKIDDPFERKLIQTVRGTGYRLVSDDDTTTL